LLRAILFFKITKHSLKVLIAPDTVISRNIRYDTIVEFNVDSKAEYSA